jgi:16S rRNA (guanine527-N7)-methyltransferase
VATRNLPARITRRGANVSLMIDPGLADRLAAYLDVLSRWNRKINLTACRVEPPDDAAVDRLVIEPLVAARHVRQEDRFVVDVGSGGGSPALPLKLALPRLRFALVESKVRKAAFLREAVRQLGLQDVEVENRRLEDFAAEAVEADMATIRGVRFGRELAETLAGLLRPGGRMFAFTSAGDSFGRSLGRVEFVDLVPERGSRLGIVEIGF